MKFALRVLLAAVLLAPLSAIQRGAEAAMDDLAYCTLLYDMAVKYKGRAIQGETKPDPDMIIALEQCKHGEADTGIATLKQKLVSAKVTPPPR
jgi:hypothetical protein